MPMLIMTEGKGYLENSMGKELKPMANINPKGNERKEWLEEWQAPECLTCQCEGLSSSPSTTKKKKLERD
jgi:hypothetical protein